MHLCVDFCLYFQAGLGIQFQIYNLEETNEAASSFSTHPETESSLAIFNDAAARPLGTQDGGEVEAGFEEHGGAPGTAEAKGSTVFLT